MHCATDLQLPPKFANHFAVVEYMQESLSLITQKAGSPSSIAVDWHYMWKGVMCGINGKLHGVLWQVQTTIAYTNAVSEVASVLVSGGLAPSYSSLLQCS